MSRRRLCLLLLGAALAGGARLGALPAAVVDSGDQIARTLPFPPGGRVLVETTNGEITVEGWDRPSIELDIRKSGGTAEDRALVPIDVRVASDEVRLTSVLPPFAPALPVVVNHHLRVPADADLRLLKTFKGRVSVSGVHGRVVIQTEEGDVTVKRFAGALEVTTMSGAIEADVAEIVSHVVLDSFNGAIHLRIPSGLRPHYAMRTLNGTIRSDMPVQIGRAFGPNIAHDASDVEEPFVRLTSVNGDLVVTQR